MKSEVTETISPEEVRAGLLDQDKIEFDNVMKKKVVFNQYLATHLSEMIAEFKIVKKKCDKMFEDSRQQLIQGSAPICRFCPAWDKGKGAQECRIRKHIMRMK